MISEAIPKEVSKVIPQVFPEAIPEILTTHQLLTRQAPSFTRNLFWFHDVFYIRSNVIFSLSRGLCNSTAGEFQCSTGEVCWGFVCESGWFKAGYLNNISLNPTFHFYRFEIKIFN